MIVAVSHVPDTNAPGTGRAKPGQPRVICCEHLVRHQNRPTEQCTAEAVADEPIRLCLRHLGLALQLLQEGFGVREFHIGDEP